MSAVFTEDTAERKIERIPLAHLSIELGHLYMEDYAAGPDRVADQFRRVAPWVAAARASAGQNARVSTCFLIDDYFSRFSSPAEIIPMVTEAAREHGLSIDYLARESGCATSGSIDLAALAEARIVDDPAPGTTGSRPPLTKTGWLCNGERGADHLVQPEAMGGHGDWRPPAQNAARIHSIFVDIELRDVAGGRRRWSCAFLASVWQLLRLGLLRHEGKPVMTPQPAGERWPGDWEALAPLVRLNPAAQPFSAYRTFSVMSVRFLPIELAVRTILGQMSVDPEVWSQVAVRASGEGVTLDDELVDRVGYVFL